MHIRKFVEANAQTEIFTTDAQGLANEGAINAYPHVIRYLIIGAQTEGSGTIIELHHGFGHRLSIFGSIP